MSSRSKVLLRTTKITKQHVFLAAQGINIATFLHYTSSFLGKTDRRPILPTTKISSTFSPFPRFSILVWGSGMLQQTSCQNLGSVCATSVSNVCERSCSVNASASTKQVITTISMILNVRLSRFFTFRKTDARNVITCTMNCTRE